MAPEGWAFFQLKHPGYPNNYGTQPSIMANFGWYHSACGIGYNVQRWCVNNDVTGGEMRPNNIAVQFMIKY